MRNHTIEIKPLSINEAFQGRRFKTKKCKGYEKKLKRILPDLVIDGTHKLSIKILWGFSSPLSDVDNPTKMFVDVLQSKYNFNDRNIFKLTLEKKIVPKGNEFITFKISNYVTE